MNSVQNQHPNDILSELMPERVNEKLFSPGDLFWSSGWLFARLLYSSVPMPLMMLTAKLKGLLKALVSKKSSRYLRLKENFTTLFGATKSERQIKAIIRQHLEYQEKLELILNLWNLPRFSHPERWPVQGMEHLDSALSQRKGAIVVVTKFGYARMIAHALRVRGYKVSVIGAGEPIKFSEQYKKEIERRRTPLTRFGKFMYERLQVASMAYKPVKDLPADFNVRPLVELLKRNEILVILGDGLHSVSFVEAKILSQILPFATGFISMAMETGAALLPAFAVDTAWGLGIKVVIEKPLPLEKTGARRKNLVANVERFARVYESYINRYPYLYRSRRKDWFERRLTRTRKGLEKDTERNKTNFEEWRHTND